MERKMIRKTTKNNILCLCVCRKMSIYIYLRISVPTVIAHRTSARMAGILIKLIKIYARQRCFATNANIDKCAQQRQRRQQPVVELQRPVKDILKRKKILLRDLREGQSAYYYTFAIKHTIWINFRFAIESSHSFKCLTWHIGCWQKQHPLLKIENDRNRVETGQQRCAPHNDDHSCFEYESSCLLPGFLVHIYPH